MPKGGLIWIGRLFAKPKPNALKERHMTRQCPACHLNQVVGIAQVDAQGILKVGPVVDPLRVHDACLTRWQPRMNRSWQRFLFVDLLLPSHRFRPKRPQFRNCPVNYDLRSSRLSDTFRTLRPQQEDIIEQTHSDDARTDPCAQAAHDAAADLSFAVSLSKTHVAVSFCEWSVANSRRWSH